MHPLKCRRDILSGLERNYWDEVIHAKEAGKRVVYGSVLMPQEILGVMGFVPVGGENVSATYAAKKVSQGFIELAETKGFTIDVCSYAKAQIGSFLANESPLGNMPKPDLILAENMSCSAFKGWFEALRWVTGNPPMVMLDVPPIHDDTSDDEFMGAVRYVEQQLRELISYLEQFTGRKFRWDELQERVAITGKAARGFFEFEELCKTVPAPISSFDVFLQVVPILCLRGRQEIVDYYKAVKAEVLERIAQRFSVVPDEKHRLYWDGIAVWSSLKEQFLSLARRGAVLVSAVYPNQLVGTFRDFDGSRPLESIARGLVGHKLNRGPAYHVDYITKLIRPYSVDGIIMQVSRTCKPNYLGQYNVIRTVSKNLGVPYVEIEGDMADPRFYSQDEVDAKIESFLEMIEERASPK